MNKIYVRIILIILGAILFIIFRRVVFENYEIIMYGCTILVAVPILFLIPYIHIINKVNKLNRNNQQIEAIEYAKNIKVYPHLSQSLILTTLIDCLHKGQMDIFISYIDEINEDKGLHWKYFIQVLYYNLIGNAEIMNHYYGLLKLCDKPDVKFQYLEDMIVICDYIFSDEAISIDLFEANIANLELVRNSVPMREILKQGFNLR